MKRTVGELYASVPEGGSQIFKAEVPDVMEKRFVSVAFNHDYRGIFSWKNQPGIREQPRIGSRQTSRRGLDTLPTPEITFSRKQDKLADFYSISLAVHAISNKLRDLIEDLDPGSLEVLPVSVKAKDGEVDYNLVMPARVLSAVDPDLCDIEIVDERLGHGWSRKVRYPNANGAAFDPELDPAIHTFVDIDVPQQWLWSRHLLEMARNAGIKGLYAMVPESYPAIVTDFL